MFAYVWPAVLIVFSNIIYNVVTKNTPMSANPFLSLTVTYLSGALVSFVMYLFMHRGTLAQNLQGLNYTAPILGLAIVGLEAGYVYLYRAGWKVSVGSITVNAVLAAVLLLIGWLAYREKISPRQIAGMVLCLTGLILMNLG